MAKAMKKCRVCGKEYDACRTPAQPGVFCWQEVACSAECGAVYLRQINESRGIVEKPAEKAFVEPPKKNKYKRDMAPQEIEESIETDGFDEQEPDSEVPIE